jgi:biotin operon repressor
MLDSVKDVLKKGETMTTSSQLITVLSRHIGKGNGIGVKQLALQLDTKERHVRTLVSELRDEGHAICGTPKSGYYIAATPEELEETCTFLHNRALHSLALEAKLKRIPLLGQLHVPT